MRIIILPFLLLHVMGGYPQSKTNSFLPDTSRLKSKITGNIQQFLRWTDHLGDNFLILTVSDQVQSPAKKAANGEACNGNCTDKELYGYHFIGNDSLLWKLADFEKACNYDNRLEFRKSATTLTDLDQNGLAEIWIMYSSRCGSDVSPRTLKLIMYQGNKKYAIRGTSQPAKNMIDEKLGGKYKPDTAFEKLSQAFTDFAKRLWEKYLYDMP